MIRAMAAGALALATLAVSPATVSARPVADSTVAVLTNDDYVDMTPVTDEGETENLIDDLEAAGHTVKRFTDISAAGFTAALDGADALAIPELERGDLYEDLSAEAAAVIADFVEAGGRLVLFAAWDAADGLNELFGFSVDGVEACTEGDEEDVPEPCVLTAEAAQTEFADGPAQLNGVNATEALVTSTLPAGSTVIYSGPIPEVQIDSVGAAAVDDAAGVAAVPFGKGSIIALGWDWYPDTESGLEPPAAEGEISPMSASDEAAWALVLDLAVSQPTVTAAAGDGQITFTSDSPSTQPIPIAVVIGGNSQMVEIPAGGTTATLAVTGPASASYSTFGWGIGAGTVEVAGAAVTPAPAPGGAAQPVVASPSFTG